MTDSHCHLGSHKFSLEEIPDIIARAQENGITRMVTLATSEEDIPTNLKIAQTYPEVHACLGIHPCDVHDTRDDFEALLVPYLSDPKVAAIGETGLDYFHPAPDGWTDEDYRARQRDFLRRHFQLAKDHGLNIVIHTRDKSGTASFHDCLEIYRDFKDHVQAVFHCFPGPYNLAEQVLDLGGLVSFTGIATFKNAHDVIETVKSCAPGTFMLETDSPYLSPVPHRGKRCEPGFTRHTGEKVAELRGMEFSALDEETEAVVCSFFRI